MIELRDVGFGYADRTGPARRRPRPRRGRAGRRLRAHRRRQVHPARRRDRAGAALHRRHAVRRRAGRRPLGGPTSRRASAPTSSGTSARTRPPGFVTDTVEEELAYGMEQLGLAPDTMRRRVEETLDLLGIADLRARDLRTLSGGEQQRVAIGSVLTMHPRRARARRADLGARPDRGRGGAGHPDPARARPRAVGADGRAPARAGGAVRRPDGAADRRRRGAGRRARRDAGRLARRTPDHRARPPPAAGSRCR